MEMVGHDHNSLKQIGFAVEIVKECIREDFGQFSGLEDSTTFASILW